MKAALTITYILFPTLIGFIIGGFVVDNGYIVGWSIALLLLDIFIGTFLKRRQEEAEEETWDNLSFEEKRAAVRDTLAGKVESARKAGIDVDRLYREYIKSIGLSSTSTETESTQRPENTSLGEKEERLSEELNAICRRMRINGRVKRVEKGTALHATEEGRFLLSLCNMMEHAPPRASFGAFSGLCTENIDENIFLVYAFNCYTLNKNIFIFLVSTKRKKLRFFTIETSISSSGTILMLCEYSEGSHINYGEVDRSVIFETIQNVIENSDEDMSVFHRVSR